MSDELSDFLAARLDEVEATAHGSGPAPIAWLTYRDPAGQMLYTTVAAGVGPDGDAWVADGKELPAPTTARVVYDPAAALREVAALRAILRFMRGLKPCCLRNQVQLGPTEAERLMPPLQLGIGGLLSSMT